MPRSGLSMHGILVHVATVSIVLLSRSDSCDELSATLVLFFLSCPAMQLSVTTVSLIIDAMSRSSISSKSGFGLSGPAIAGVVICKLLVGRSMLV